MYCAKKYDNRRLNLYGGYQVDVSVREMKKICKETERQ